MLAAAARCYLQARNTGPETPYRSLGADPSRTTTLALDFAEHERAPRSNRNAGALESCGSAGRGPHTREMGRMVRSEMPEPAGDGQSLGDLVALAAKDVSQLVRSDID